MTRPPVLLSSPLDNLAGAARVADGIEVKLDWEHARRLSSERQLADVCETQGVEADRLVSVYLPPGMNRANGMSIAPGNIGKILEFTHSAFGDEVSPEWLTVHTARRFDYREHVERLATITNVTGYRLAVGNTPIDRTITNRKNWPCSHSSPIESTASRIRTCWSIPRTFRTTDGRSTWTRALSEW